MRSKIVYDTRGNAKYFIEGKEVSEKEWKKTCRGMVQGKVATTLLESSKSWPRKSLALGVHPSQKKEAEAYYQKLGVPTEFDAKTGKAIVRNNAHQIAISKARGWANQDGGYGQIAG